MKYDAEKITRLVSELQKSKTLLKELATMRQEEFILDAHKIASAKYNLIVAIETIIDICNHLISQNGYRVPEDYADTFRVMRENGLLDEKSTQTLIEMAKFRNRLVHLYWMIDNEVLSSILIKDLKDFDNFLKELGNILTQAL